jgi:hypothetical protein
VDREGNNMSRRTATDGYNAAGTGYGTFEDSSPRLVIKVVEEENRKDKRRDEESDNTTSGEDEGTIRKYTVSSSNQRLLHVKMNQLTLAVEGGETLDNRKSIADEETDENGNSGTGRAAIALREAKSRGKARSHDEGTHAGGSPAVTPLDDRPRSERSREEGPCGDRRSRDEGLCGERSSCDDGVAGDRRSRDEGPCGERRSLDEGPCGKRSSRDEGPCVESRSRDEGPGSERSRETGDSPAEMSVPRRAKPSLLVTTTVSFDENHKRNSIHMFVADVNETEHINETEETTHV